MIAAKWSTRPADFFRGVTEDSLEKLIPFLTVENMAEIKAKESKKNPAACKVSAKYLPRLSQKESLPKLFRLSVYELLAQSAKTLMAQIVEATPHKWIGIYVPQATGFSDIIESIARAIPVLQMEKDARLIIRVQRD